MQDLSMQYHFPIHQRQLMHKVSLDKTDFPASSTLDANPFMVNDFVISTSTANIAHFATDGSELQFIRKEHDSDTHAIACHPSEPRLCIGSYSGLLQLWDYEK
ncbi:Cilia- and flagella-associated protein 251, partial [Desmophyllum pertusum]